MKRTDLKTKPELVGVAEYSISELFWKMIVKFQMKTGGLCEAAGSIKKINMKFYFVSKPDAGRRKLITILLKSTLSYL